MPFFVRRSEAPIVKGGYQSFRPYVREDFQQQCAYCLLEEIVAAGEENFELDHFRPKGRFPERLNDFYNIYYACHPCNHIKRDAWPSLALEAHGIGFVDLCKEEFINHFVAHEDGKWEGITASARYTIDILRLNRRHLVTLRQELWKLTKLINKPPLIPGQIR